MLEIKRVSKSFKRKTALYETTLSIEKGSCVALCGGNGAGKSTLIDMLVTASKPTSGIIEVDGLKFYKTEKQPYLQKIAYMPDDFELPPVIKVKEFLTFYGKLRKVSAERIDDVLKLIELEDKRTAYLTELSKGMRQRVLLGQALLSDADYIILDEPTNGLDPYWINRFIEIMQTELSRGKTIVFSTHMMDVAAELADRAIFLEGGKVVEDITLSKEEEHAVLLEKLLRIHRSQHL
ncbi:ABC transporter ATP-binding protein [Listeria floridensis]|uniref:ABC transporter ATP-binding protein n=1 Tax=Listeria floridensis TaxID=1494962 RepID=UPI001F4D2750|nr:ABC transporter ATP-binding protein [Listeria floridensis]